MAQNIFSVKDQTELNSIIHISEDSCTGVGCEWCSKFYKASGPVKTAAENGANITVSQNEKPVEVKGWYFVWCDSCSDGENTNFWDACDWAERHANSRHKH